MAGAGARVQQTSNAIKRGDDGAMADRLRELIDLVLDSLDEPARTARALADRAHFSRDHLDRLLAAATGESPVALRRRLLLERAAWQLRTGAATPSEAAAAAGYGSLAAFSRAFARAYGVPPSAFAASGARSQLEAPNGIHFHPPAGLLVPGAPAPRRRTDLTDRLVTHHLDRVRELLRRPRRCRPRRWSARCGPGLVVVWFEGEEASAALMAERLVFTLEVWVAAISGEPHPGAARGRDLPAAVRARRARFARLAARIRDARRVGRRVRRRAVRAAAVVHLRRRARPRPQLRRGPPRGARRRPARARRAGRERRPDRVGGRSR